MKAECQATEEEGEGEKDHFGDEAILYVNLIPISTEYRVLYRITSKVSAAAAAAHIHKHIKERKIDFIRVTICYHVATSSELS